MEQQLYVESLQKGRQRKKLTVRVLRKWTVYETGGYDVPLYVGMVWADAQGNGIYAEIPREIIGVKEYLLDVGKVYDIKMFIVDYAKAKYKPFHGKFMIELSEFTTIELVRDPPLAIPEYIYNLTPLDKVVATDGAVITYTDVIGYITKYSAVSTFIPKSKEKVVYLREVFIKDLSNNEMKVTLWAEKALDFNIRQVYNAETANVVVCLFVGCTPRKMYNAPEKPYLNGNTACFYYFNPQIPEAQPYYSRFANIPVYVDCPTAAEEDMLQTVHDTPLLLKTIEELNNINPFEFENGTYKCSVMVTSIPVDVPWWYVSCRHCKKKMDRDPDRTYICPNGHGSDIKPRYLLSFIGKDDKAEARFFAYDDEAKQIVLKECESIVNPQAASTDLPPDLHKIIGKKYVFGIDLPDSSAKTLLNRQYLVRSVLEKPPRRPQRPPVTAPTAPGTHTLLQTGPSAIGVSGSQLEITTADNSRSPQIQSETYQIEATAQSTPPPSLEPKQTPLQKEVPQLVTDAHLIETATDALPRTASINSELRFQSKPCRNLLPELDEAEEEMISNEEVLPTHSELDGATSCSLPLQQSPKRAKLARTKPPSKTTRDK